MGPELLSTEDSQAVISLNWGWQPVADQYGFIFGETRFDLRSEIAPVGIGTLIFWMEPFRTRRGVARRIALMILVSWDS